MPNPKNGLRGASPVAAILIDLGADKAAAMYNRVFFDNNAAPNGVIEVPEDYSDAAFKRLQTQFREQHRGVRNAHRVAMLEEGAKWKDTSYSMKDMLFPEMREMTAKLVLTAFGMSKTMIGQTEDVNRATAEAAFAIFHEQVVDEMNERIKQALNTQFLPMFGDLGSNVEFDFVSAAPENAEKANAELTSKTQAYATLIREGVDPEDAAIVCGLPPMKMREVQSAPEREPATA
jgi:HK97 family phage portal protein